MLLRLFNKVCPLTLDRKIENADEKDQKSTKF